MLRFDKFPDLIVDHSHEEASGTLQSESRLKRRLDDQVKKKLDELLAGRGVTDLTQGGQISIRVTLEEPVFGYNYDTGKPEFVFLGNPKYRVGDIIKKPEGGMGGGKGNQAGKGGAKEDDGFVFEVPADELTRRILEGLALPNMKQKRILKRIVESRQRAGHRSYGPPATFDVMKTATRAHARRLALHRPTLLEIEDLEDEIDRCELSGDPAVKAALPELLRQLTQARGRRTVVPFFDKGDLRYRRHETIERPVTAAVMFAMMDKSGSMSQHRKDLAKRFFWLLRFFLQQEYETVHIVWIQHTDYAQEVDETTFFRGTETGGTVVSSALEEMLKIQKERYPLEDYNIYCCQAGDGDTGWSWVNEDDAVVSAQILQQHILPMSQYYAYIECHESGTVRLDADPRKGKKKSEEYESRLWQVYGGMIKPSHFAMKRVSDAGQIYPVFRNLFASAERV